MKRIIFLLFILFPSLSYSQKPSLHGLALIDSLSKELSIAKGDSNEVLACYYLTHEYYGSNPEKGLEYGMRGLNLAKELKWEFGEAKMNRVIGLCIIIKNLLRFIIRQLSN